MTENTLWRAVRPTARFVPVYLRNLLVWRKLALASMVGNMAEPLITLVAFGFGLGSLLPQLDGQAYIVFLAAGSVCASTAMSASFEALYSAFSRMHVQKTWEAILNTPLELDDVLLAEWLWAATKSAFSGLAIVLVIVVLGISREPTLLALPLVVALTGLCFGALGLCCNAIARGYDSFTYYFTLFMTPMIFLSGVYFPVQQLPSWLQGVCAVLPLSAAVELARPLLRGEWPARVAIPAATLLIVAVLAFQCAAVLTRRRLSA